MKIRLTRNTRLPDRSGSVGDEVEVSDKVGRQLILMGKAIEIKLPTTDPHPAPLPTGEGEMDGLIENEVIFDLPKARAPKKKK